MTEFKRTIQVDHKADNLFELVHQIERYPEFIRWIQSMSVEEISKSDDKIVRIGHAVVGFRGFTEDFSTKVTSDPVNRTIDVELVKGPLKTLANRWEFKPRDENTSDVDMYVDFEFRNIFLRAFAAANFELAVNRIMSAFIAEADRRYSVQA